MHDLFLDIGVILILTTLLGLFCEAIGQSLVVAYIGAGILMGPSGQKMINAIGEIINVQIPHLGIINNVELVNTLSVFGVILLLFMVGLEMNIKDLRNLKKGILWICLGQILLTTGLGYLLTYYFLKSHAAALLVGTALTFSSTIIGVKVLSDKKDLNSLYGKIMIGVLLAQDLVAILALVLLNSIQAGAGIGMDQITLIAAKFISLFGFTFVWANYILPPLFDRIAKRSELVFLAAIANCFLLAGIAHLLDVSVEIGAFLGGISLASLPLYLQLISKVRPLRDFFLVLFFVSLGLSFNAPSIQENLPLVGILTLFAVLIKPIVVILVVTLTGFKKRTAFMSGIGLGQLSEFSLILLGLALTQGLIDNALMSTVTLAMILSLVISTHLSYRAHKLFLKVGKHLHFLEHQDPASEKMHSFKQKMHNHIILCGYAGMGQNILRSIKKSKHKHIVVDINPEQIQELIRKRTQYIFGDMTDPEVLELMSIPNAKILISTVSSHEDNLFLLDYISKHNKELIVLVEASSVAKALELYERGADYVILTEHIGGDHASLLLEDLYGENNVNFFRHRNHHIEFLKKQYKRV